MRQVNLNGTYFPIHSDIRTKRINPWKAKLGASSLEYSDFSQAELEEYFDFRNGIGKKRGVGSDSRLDWSEGIDFTSEGQAVLDPLVTTAGTFAEAPVKILDFQDATYAVGTSKVSKWNTSTSAWDTKWDVKEIFDCDTAWVSEQGANASGVQYTDIMKEGTASTLVTIGAAATTGDVLSKAISEVDLTSKNNVCFWLYLVSGTVSASDFSFKLYDGAVLKATVNIPAGVTSTWGYHKVTADLSACTAIDNIILYMNTDRGALSFILDIITADPFLATPLDAVVVTDATDEYLVVSDANFAIYSTDGATWIGLVGCQGYLAWYDTKLRSIDTDGGTVRSSAANNVDGTWTTFDLTGDFGTVYSLFEGKLLADGTPTIYFTGTKGLYTIDVTNEIAYQQEVAYPPLTYAGHKGMYWNSNVWVATGYGILKVAPSVATFIGPDLDDGLPSGYQGLIYDLETVNNWLVFCVNGGTTDKSSILKRNSTLGGNLQIYTTSAANNPIACLHHSPSSLYTNGRLWFGEGTGIKYMMFTDTTSNVKQVATYTYVNDSGYGKFPIFRKLAAISKTALGVAAITKSCVDVNNEYIEVFYGLNGAAPTTSLGTFLTSPKPTALTFNSGLGTAFYTIQLAVKLYRGATTTNSPELESLMFYYIPCPSTILAWQFRIECTDENSAETIAAMEAIRDTNTLVAFYPSGDVNKTSYNIKLTQLGEQVMFEEQGAKQGYLDVTCEEVFKG
uniref:Uncharacterized protein n=1 Tax=viral metagenome TaxID=1070528 RepID=A0A6M3LFR1_9ZZZZ